MERYLIVISRDRPELLETLNLTLHGQEGGFEILLDRREREISTWGGPGPDRRSTLSVKSDLETNGFMVVKRS